MLQSMIVLFTFVIMPLSWVFFRLTLRCDRFSVIPLVLTTTCWMSAEFADREGRRIWDEADTAIQPCSTFMDPKADSELCDVGAGLVMLALLLKFLFLVLAAVSIAAYIAMFI